MPHAPSLTARESSRHNVARRLTDTARQRPDQVAVAVPAGKSRDGQRQYEQLTFRQLDEDSDRLAAGLQRSGLRPGMRIVLLIRPGIDFISLTFALLKAGAVVVLIDPGMGRRHLLQCLQDVVPDGFVALPIVHAVRLLQRHRFPQARLNVTAGRRWFWGGPTLSHLRQSSPEEFTPPTLEANDPAAIIFTTGSTGPPKGVLYCHGNFSGQVDRLREFYCIQPGEIDLPGFPLFALFNAALGVTTVVPEMDFTRPAKVDPRNIVQAVNDWQVTQAFGSPALWNVVGQYCQQNHIQLPSLRRVLSAGAPVPVHVLQRMKQSIAADGDVHTPYGATEALPVASIAATDVLQSTATRSQAGAGTCVGQRFAGIRWKIIAICDDAIESLDQAKELPPGEIGELIVQGPVVTREYVTRIEVNRLAKIRDGQGFWHRMGDVGYLDEKDRFWFCGRKAHRVITSSETLYTIPCEAIFNNHPQVYRSALVGIGSAGQQQPVLIAEPWPDQYPADAAARQQLIEQLHRLGQAHPHTRLIAREHILLRRTLPVDIRHNAKIFREKLAVWATHQLASR